MVGNDYKLIRKKKTTEKTSFEKESEERRATGERREQQETDEKRGRKQREDELNKRLNNTHQGLINCCSMGATS